MDLTVRDARPDDAPAVLAILNPIIGSGLYAVFDAPLAEEDERRYIAELPSRGIFYVAVRQGAGALVDPPLHLQGHGPVDVGQRHLASSAAR